MHFTSLPCPLPQAGFVLHESTAYAAYLLRRGVPAGDLLKECQVGWAGCTAGRSMSPQAQLARMHQIAGLLARTVYLIPLADEARQQCMHPPAAVVRHGGQRLLLALYARPARQLAVSTWASGCWAAAAWLQLLALLPCWVHQRDTCAWLEESSLTCFNACSMHPPAVPRQPATCLDCCLPVVPPLPLRRIAVVTSEFHVPRTQATFDFM